MKYGIMTLAASLLLATQASPAADDGGPFFVSLTRPLATVIVDELHIAEYRVVPMRRFDEPLAGIDTVFELTHVESGAQRRVAGIPTEDPLVATANIVLDRPGEWTSTAILLNFRDTASSLTRLPPIFAVESGTSVAVEPPPATPVPNGPGLIRIEDEALAPWHLEVPLGLKVLFENGSGYSVSIWIAEGGSFDEEVRLAPGRQTMWYSLVPGDYQVVVGPVPAFRVGTITVTG